jgi:hypothetical protein
LYVLSNFAFFYYLPVPFPLAFPHPSSDSDFIHIVHYGEGYTSTDDPSRLLTTLRFIVSIFHHDDKVGQDINGGGDGWCRYVDVFKLYRNHDDIQFSQ